MVRRGEIARSLDGPALAMDGRGNGGSLLACQLRSSRARQAASGAVGAQLCRGLEEAGRHHRVTSSYGMVLQLILGLGVEDQLAISSLRDSLLAGDVAHLRLLCGPA